MDLGSDLVSHRETGEGIEQNRQTFEPVLNRVMHEVLDGPAFAEVDGRVVGLVADEDLVDFGRQGGH